MYHVLFHHRYISYFGKSDKNGIFHLILNYFDFRRFFNIIDLIFFFISTHAYLCSSIVCNYDVKSLTSFRKLKAQEYT